MKKEEYLLLLLGGLLLLAMLLTLLLGGNRSRHGYGALDFLPSPSGRLPNQAGGTSMPPA